MGIFSYNFYDSGQGAPKTPLGRAWTFYTENIGRLYAGGTLAALGSIVFIIGMTIAVDSHAIMVVFITGPLGGMLALPQLCGLTDIILRALQNKSGSWWATYRRAWKQNVKGCLMPGALGGLLFGFQFFVFFNIERLKFDLFLLIAIMLSVVLSTAIATWLLLQLALVELPLNWAAVNAVLLCVRYPLRTLGVTLLQIVYWALIVFGLPYTSVLLFLFNFWLPSLIVTMVLYVPLKRVFHIEEDIKPCS